MIFSRRTYRKARYASIQRIMNAYDWYERTQHPSYPAHVRHAALADDDRELRLGMAIVARGRRERGLWKV